MARPEVGIESVRFARAAIELGLSDDPPTDPAIPFRSRPLDPEFEEKRGVFVTLSQFPGGLLRGCIGIPLPVYPLREAVPRAAVSAAVEDPRFPPVDRAELLALTIEVSLLTPPQPLRPLPPRERWRGIEVGRHGLIVRRGRRAGLLLPQVATEYEWGEEEFLRETCLKAGLPEDAWLAADTEIETFEAAVYGEESPRGPVIPHPTRLEAPGRSVPRS